MTMSFPPSGRKGVNPHRGVRVAASVACLAILVCAGLPSSSASGGANAHLAKSAAAAQPNIVFVLTDDLSTNLVRYMPTLKALQHRGMTFTNYTVSNSLCCPSRASIFTGEFPHNTGVLSNTAPSGGYPAFQAHGDQTHTFAVSLAGAGYRTGFFGKYLNGYNPATHPRNAPGWSQWGAVDGHGYREYGYNMSVNGKLVHHGDQPSDYLTSVLDRMSQRFIRSSASSGDPFALEVATFSPHSPYVAAPSDLNKFANLRMPHTPAFDTHPANAPRWLAARPALTPAQLKRGQSIFRKRVRCVQSLDRLLSDLQTTLQDVHQLANTVFVFSSDNGFHIGDYGLTAGKLTAFETDVNVPLVVAGPGIAAGSASSASVENIDLAPTFDDLAGTSIPARVDGHSAVALLHGRSVPWRTLAAVEHYAVKQKPGDPDYQSPSAGRLPSYNALRSPSFTYVEYARGQHEYYDRTRDSYELDNMYRDVSRRTIRKLHRELAALTRCSGQQQCWTAAAPAK
jgi:N-acetylglucosamine-6-sulfatase